MPPMYRITIRPMTASDVQPIAIIMVATPLWQRYAITVETAAARLASGLQEDAILLVAADESSDEPLGFVWLVLRGAFNRSSYIPLIAVHPDRRGGGIGQQLLEVAEELTRKSADDIFLLCSDFNLDAQRFYERQGYQRVGVLPDYMLPGLTELIYRKRL
jgi:ribosomal protein S18 acetylase RimI-like enzyme